MLSTAKKQVEQFREQYEQLLAEDKEQDRFFKRDFADCEPYTDQLYKLFRKRPRCATYIPYLSSVPITRRYECSGRTIAT